MGSAAGCPELELCPEHWAGVQQVLESAQEGQGSFCHRLLSRLCSLALRSLHLLFQERRYPSHGEG